MALVPHDVDDSTCVGSCRTTWTVGRAWPRAHRAVLLADALELGKGRVHVSTHKLLVDELALLPATVTWRLHVCYKLLVDELALLPAGAEW